MLSRSAITSAALEKAEHKLLAAQAAAALIHEEENKKVQAAKDAKARACARYRQAKEDEEDARLAARTPLEVLQDDMAELKRLAEAQTAEIAELRRLDEARAEEIDTMRRHEEERTAEINVILGRMALDLHRQVTAPFSYRI